jgi:hypothetical protein
MKMPFAVYEALPYLYVISGAAALLGIGDMGGQISAALLMVMGGVILRMRIRYRRGLAINPATVSRSW